MLNFENNNFKGAVSVISKDPPCKDGNGTLESMSGQV